MARLIGAAGAAVSLTWAAMAGPPATGMSPAAAAKHWAFQPVVKPPLPVVRQTNWPRTPIDSFILAKLEAANRHPSPPADRRTLLRRVYFDLIGLPPTFEDVVAFERDPSPDAYAKVVERLLASPQYGERWGRHWLDVARFADTKDGVLMFGDDRIRPYAYTYRDYVIRAFNDDTPYNQFIHEQLAADQLVPRVEPWRLAAMGFLTLGRMFDNNIHDIIDDRIDTVTRGFLALTVSCARCHDHKYDAVPTRDYYSLYGVFASCEAPLELPVTDTKASESEFEKQLTRKRLEAQQMLDNQYATLTETARKRTGDYLVHVATTDPDPLETAIFFLSLAPTDLRPPITARWRRYLEQRVTPDDPVFGPWHDLMKADAPAFGSIIEQWKTRPVNPLVRDTLLASKPKTKADVARTYGALLVRIYDESKAGPLTDPTKRQLLDIVVGRDSPTYFPKSQTRRYMSRSDTDMFGGKLQELDRMAVKSPQAAPRAMTLNDLPELHDPHVFVRGNASRLGEAVPRQFLQVLAGEQRKPFPKGSGRLNLAQAISDVKNPLTARVMVNRVWMHHFGEPLVSTPSDFGARSNPPTHPELLDYLAATFTTGSGWSLKSLHRMMVMSATYQQSSNVRNTNDGVRNDSDPLYGRMIRRRLDMEPMRDAMLAVAGRLDSTMYGRPVDVAGDGANRRRTVYGMVDRQSLPGLFRAFDFASPDASAERRPKTIVPQQALFGLNSPFVLEQGRSLAARPQVAAARTDRDRIVALYQLTFARIPDDDEIERGLRFLQGGGPLPQYAQVLLLTNEMLFVD